MPCAGHRSGLRFRLPVRPFADAALTGVKAPGLGAMHPRMMSDLCLTFGAARCGRGATVP